MIATSGSAKILYNRSRGEIKTKQDQGLGSPLFNLRNSDL
jgi:hypothetical protein